MKKRKYDGRDTPAGILVCDVCSMDLSKRLEHGMLFWWPQRDPHRLTLACKGCVADRARDGLYSAELWWFASRGIQRVAAMSDYEWSADELRTLVHVAWAVSVVAKRGQRTDAKRFSEIWL